MEFQYLGCNICFYFIFTEDNIETHSSPEINDSNSLIAVKDAAIIDLCGEDSDDDNDSICEFYDLTSPNSRPVQFKKTLLKRFLDGVRDESDLASIDNEEGAVGFDQHLLDGKMHRWINDRCQSPCAKLPQVLEFGTIHPLHLIAAWIAANLII